jgi:phosphoglycolate phosphatase
MRDSFPELFGERWEHAAQHYQQTYRAMHLGSLQPLPNAQAMLSSIPTSIFLGVVSNKRGEPLRLEADHLNWSKYFGSVVGADDAESDKPSAAPALLALKDSGILPGPHVWFVGDTVVDLECAKNLGATPILYGDHVTADGVYDGHPFAAQVRNHAELIALLAQH